MIEDKVVELEARIKVLEDKVLVVVKEEDSKIVILFKEIKDKVIFLKEMFKEKLKAFLLKLADKIK